MIYLLLIVGCILLAFLVLVVLFKLINPKRINWKRRFFIHCLTGFGLLVFLITWWGIHIIPQTNYNRQIGNKPEMTILEYLSGEWSGLHLLGLMILVIALFMDYLSLKSRYS